MTLNRSELRLERAVVRPMPSRRCEFALVSMTAAALALAPEQAQAGGDLMWGTRGGDSMVERQHQIEMSFERGYATMVVRRTVHNGIERPDQAIYELLLPEGGVAIGLRTLGERRGKSHWYEGDLLERELAAARYRELTGFEPHQPKVKDPALLAWNWTGGLVLQVFPVVPNTEKTVEYTIDMPAFWENGRWAIWLDETGLDEQPAELIIHPSNASDRLYVDDQPIEAGHRMLLDTSHSLTLAPAEQAPVELELASVDTGRDRNLVHWRISVASELAKLPKNAHIVVALDLSRSLSDEEVEAQRRAALLYLEHFRASSLAAKVAVFGFDHAIRPLTDSFVSADEARGTLLGAVLARGNGSAVDLALAEAGRLLDSASARAPKRVLLMTDFMTSSSRSLADIEALAASTDAIVHLAELATGYPRMYREDLHPWARIAAQTEGVVWRASVPLDDDPVEHELAQEVLEEWARPIRIDELHVELGELDVSGSGVPFSLARGDGFEEQQLTAATTDRMTVTGLLWNRPVEHVAKRSRSLSRRWAALVFGSYLIDELEREEMLHLATHGGAVSPVTSYLAIEPGVRPSIEGLKPGEGNTGLIGKGGGGGTGSGSGVGSGAGFGGRLDRQAWLDEQLGGAWERCGGAGQRGTIVLETTYDELVDFALTAPADTALVTCMRAQTWALVLPVDDFIDERANWTVEIL
jgi:hypothetical protein